MTVCYTQIYSFMVTGTATKTSAKSDLDIAKAIENLQSKVNNIDTLQKQVNENTKAIKQALPRDKTQISNNTVLSLIFVILVAMIGWVKIDQNGLRPELSQRIDKVNERLDKVSDRLDKIYTLLLKNK